MSSGGKQFLISADVVNLSLHIQTNPEWQLAIDQDPLGRQATQFSNDDGKIVYAKTLEDGSYAVGLFNRGNVETTVGVKWGPWGILPTRDAGTVFTVRDLWRQKDLGNFKGKFETKVAPHGVVLVRLVPTRS